MKTICKKLRSDRGSSMVLALFLMLVALMVSHTILAAAATAGQNVVQQRESQQAYLTVSSAAETFRDSVLSFNGDNSFRRVHPAAIANQCRCQYSNLQHQYKPLRRRRMTASGYRLSLRLSHSLWPQMALSGYGTATNLFFTKKGPT